MYEKTTLLAFLESQRAAVLEILDGLDDEALVTAVLPSKWTPLGMIEHLGDAERHWFQEVLLGVVEPVGTPTSPTAYYREQRERANAAIAATELDAKPVGRHPGERAHEVTDLRWIMLHMIEETARHAGHLDVVRELLDGTTGLGPR